MHLRSGFWTDGGIEDHRVVMDVHLTEDELKELLNRGGKLFVNDNQIRTIEDAIHNLQILREMKVDEAKADKFAFRKVGTQ